MSRLHEYFARARLALRYRGVAASCASLPRARPGAAALSATARGQRGDLRARVVPRPGGAVPATVVVTGSGGAPPRRSPTDDARARRGLVRAADASTAAVNKAVAATPRDVVLLGPEVRVYDLAPRLQWYARRSEEGARTCDEHPAAIGARELDPDGSVRACGLFHDPRSRAG